MLESTTLTVLSTILGTAAIAVAAVYGTRYRKRRRAEKMRRRGYKAYNRGRPKLEIDTASHPGMAEQTLR